MLKQFLFILKSYILWIWFYLYKPYRDKRKEEANKRIKLCEECEHFNNKLRICKLCKCFLDVKTKMYFHTDKNGKSIGGCKIKKW